MSKLSPEAASAYVAHCLRLNPMWEAEAVLAARADAHGISADERSPHHRAAEEARRKTELRDRVYRLRDGVWTQPLDRLRRDLADLSLDGEPELQALAAKLRTIANNRAQLPALTQDKRFDGDFFDCFKQVLAGGPRESAAMREQVVSSFQDKVLRRRGMRMLKLMRREVPELCELEKDWLRSLGVKPKSIVPAKKEKEGNGCLWLFVIYVVAKAAILSRLLSNE